MHNIYERVIGSLRNNAYLECRWYIELMFYSRTAQTIIEESEQIFCAGIRTESPYGPSGVLVRKALVVL